MEKLWAPWRMTYIDCVDDDEGCFMCKARESDDDACHLVVWRSELTFCVMNKFPYNNGHLLIATNRHEGDVEKLTTDEVTAMMLDTIKAQKVLRKVCRPQGFNWGLNVGRVAGAGVADHLHMHIVPRWNGDTNFMPVFADVKVIPQALEELYGQLREAARTVD